MNEYTITQIGEVTGVPARIFNSGAVDENNNSIVWESDVGNDSEIFFYNGSETIQLTDNDVGDFEPAVSDNNVAWLRNDGNDAEVFLYNGSETIQLTDNDVDDFFPAVSGNNVIWTNGSGSDEDLFLYDGSEIIQLTDLPFL